MIVADRLHLPRVDEPPANLALLVLGKALAETYRDVTDQPHPEYLAVILSEIERREVKPPGSR